MAVVLLWAPSAYAADAAIAFGAKHAIALRTNGDVLTWGDNVGCQLGRPVTARNARQSGSRDAEREGNRCRLGSQPRPDERGQSLRLGHESARARSAWAIATTSVKALSS